MSSDVVLAFDVARIQLFSARRVVLCCGEWQVSTHRASPQTEYNISFDTSESSARTDPRTDPSPDIASRGVMKKRSCSASITCV